MVMSLMMSIFHLFFSVHQFLYAPTFPSLPLLHPIPVSATQTITLPVQRLTAPSSQQLNAESFMVVDQNSGETIVAHNPDEELFPASTTKIMTAMVVLDSENIDTVVTIPPGVPEDGSVMKLVPGEQLTIRQLLEGMLVHSSNDAAEALARLYPGGRNAFIQAMNDKARSLSMFHTVYKNPSGLIDDGHVTTVRDLLILSRYAMLNPTFASFVKEQFTTITSLDGKVVHKLETTNELLGKVEGVEGVKTGWTQEAGECLVTQVTRGGHTILTAVLKSTDRFGESTTLINWVFDTYRWKSQPLSSWEQGL
ncbi:D-alanyl-D-alanine carboxypeptidase [Candidatus Cerribacteria bacterium 'Amazon FNV 2010 28 9']|uniref:D-alanyl-D-alanine carboxypeptidase n=1 Tax=Candidatus Cerribacteria bacterium 'Amazon FNV 2010 28 9' TaxID=2081795 RepID=A0A317JQJ5_9BACT|nr:MAG: D-alanyl-D-alanine carboxypeptidase [Candidatus Cerribacteria bacterium 'Amazon FNV 2010 28 9']